MRTLVVSETWAANSVSNPKGRPELVARYGRNNARRLGGTSEHVARVSPKWPPMEGARWPAKARCSARPPCRLNSSRTAMEKSGDSSAAALARVEYCSGGGRCGRPSPPGPPWPSGPPGPPGPPGPKPPGPRPLGHLGAPVASSVSTALVGRASGSSRASLLSPLPRPPLASAGGRSDSVAPARAGAAGETPPGARPGPPRMPPSGGGRRRRTRVRRLVPEQLTTAEDTRQVPAPE